MPVLVVMARVVVFPPRIGALPTRASVLTARVDVFPPKPVHLQVGVALFQNKACRRLRLVLYKLSTVEVTLKARHSNRI